jgi:hypothetical protein
MDEYVAVAQTEIQPGWEVIDADGERIGEVREVSDGGFLVETSLSSITLGFADVESADDGTVELAIGEDELRARNGGFSA